MIGLAGQYATVDELLTGRENLELVGLLYHLDQAGLPAPGRRRPGTDVARRGRGQARQDLLGRHAAPPGPGRQPHRPARRSCSWTSRPPGSTPGRATSCGSSSKNSSPTARPCCSRRRTWRKPSTWRTRSSSWTPDVPWPTGTADELKDQLGGNVLEVRVSRRADLERGRLAHRGPRPRRARLDPELNKVSLPVKGGPRVLIAAGRALDDSGMALDDLGIRRPSLDDVFLALTGHATGFRRRRTATARPGGSR